jgi:hypothetical protein
MCAENMGDSTKEMFFLLNPEDAIKAVKRDGYFLMPKEELPGFDLDKLYEMVKTEGFEADKSDHNLIYDPSRIETKTVNVEKGLDSKYKEEGWEEVQRSGDYAILIKKKTE